MSLNTLLVAIISVILPLTASAQIFDGSTNTQIELNQVLEQIKPGQILVIGELHGLKPIHDQQMGILQALRERGHKVAVGMEFFNYTDQALINEFRAGSLSEVEFKKAIGWGSTDFNLYSPQLLFGEAGLGINIPRAVTSQISKNGIASLTPEQQLLMPPNFTLGNEAYKRRFFEVMGGHVSPEKFINYFAAQSVWDETMAWQALNFVKVNPDYTYVIIVGEFHVAYGGGLPDRLRARLFESNICNTVQVKTISQVYTEGLTPEEVQKEIAPSELDGARADFIFLSK
ncbi:MAG: ChaN family lipoprotein [Bdellovibrionota bacterium]